MTRDHSEAAEPLREALERLSDAVKARLGTMDYYFGPNARTATSGKDRAAFHAIADALEAAREALAAATEPEWEYRACLERDAPWGTYRSAPQREVSARSFDADEHDAAFLDFHEAKRHANAIAKLHRDAAVEARYEVRWPTCGVHEGSTHVGACPR